MWDLIVSVPDHCLSFYLGCSLNMYTVKQILQFWSEKYKYYTINSANKEDADQSACMRHQNQCLRKMSRKNLQTYRYYTINSANNSVDFVYSFF